jgi:hypothetical protein
VNLAIRDLHRPAVAEFRDQCVEFLVRELVHEECLDGTPKGLERSRSCCLPFSEVVNDCVDLLTVRAGFAILTGAISESAFVR